MAVYQFIVVLNFWTGSIHVSLYVQWWWKGRRKKSLTVVFRVTFNIVNLFRCGQEVFSRLHIVSIQYHYCTFILTCDYHHYTLECVKKRSFYAALFQKRSRYFFNFFLNTGLLERCEHGTRSLSYLSLPLAIFCSVERSRAQQKNCSVYDAMQREREREGDQVQWFSVCMGACIIVDEKLRSTVRETPLVLCFSTKLLGKSMNRQMASRCMTQAITMQCCPQSWPLVEIVVCNQSRHFYMDGSDKSAICFFFSVNALFCTHSTVRGACLFSCCVCTNVAKCKDLTTAHSWREPDLCAPCYVSFKFFFFLRKAAVVSWWVISCVCTNVG